MRIIRADILDRDIFAEHPTHTSVHGVVADLYLISSTKLPAIARGTNPSFLLLKLLLQLLPATQSRAMQAIGDGAV